ncbi:hypothetical protein LUZ60_004045 [Juncus effusus]|nr:hypothetical protein LUZ60_004045 [Juncus effusus]
MSYRSTMIEIEAQPSKTDHQKEIFDKSGTQIPIIEIQEFNSQFPALSSRSSSSQEGTRKKEHYSIQIEARLDMEGDVVKSELVLPPVMAFKRIQTADKYPKGQSRGRYWKHLKQLLQAENFISLPHDEPNYLNIEAPPSIYPSKKYCDITGFEAAYVDPRTKMRYTDPDAFRRVRNLPNEQVQRYLSLRNAAVVFK